MIDPSDDRLLQNILLDAAAGEYAAELASIEEVTTSPRFQRQMKKMLANPNAWAKRRKRPLWKQCLSWAAMLLFVCSLTLGAMMAISPTVRAAVTEWVIEWYETYVFYRFFGEDVLEVMPRYDITELPSGYKSPGEVQELMNCVRITYKNEEGDIIYFEYDYTKNNFGRIINTENSEIYEIEIRGCPGNLYLSTIPEESNAIAWYDVQNNFYFMIDGFCDKSELLKMADSISLCNTTK